MSSTKDLFIEVSPGDAVFKEGEVGTVLYIIESGQIDLIPAGGGDALATLGPGDSCGEAALLKQHPHTSTAMARTRARLLRIDAAAVPDVLHQNADVGFALLRKLAARQSHYELRFGDTRIAPTAPAPAPAAKPATAAAPAKPESAPQARTQPPPPPAPASASAPAPAQPVAPPAPSKPKELALRVSANGQMIALDPARGEYLVGRPDPASGIAPEIDLGPFDANRMLSRRHAKILREADNYLVREDAATTNGTFLNGERLQTGIAAPLKAGDKLRFGSIEVELVEA